MESFVQKYKAAVYYILVLTLSGLMLILQSHISRASEYSLSLPQLAPTQVKMKVLTFLYRLSAFSLAIIVTPYFNFASYLKWCLNYAL